MSALYRCFQQSSNVNEFKERVFANRSFFPYEYRTPLEETLHLLGREALIEEVMADLQSPGVLRSRIERVLEQQYADFFNEVFLQEALAS